jgi:hypothetical protein
MTDTRVPAEQLTAQFSERFRADRTRWAVAGIATVMVVGAGILGVGLLGSGDTITGSVAGVREVVVTVGAGPVTLTGTSGTAVGVETTSHGLFAADAGYSLEDGVLTVYADGWGLDAYTEANLAIPAGIPVHVYTGGG